MPRRIVKIVHLICPTELRVENLGRGRYSTGTWVVAECVAEEAEFVALHKSRREPSYLQGRKVSWKTERRAAGSAHDEGRRFWIEVEGPAVSWPARGGAGEKGYTYR
jgi:hypothetical protein